MIPFVKAHACGNDFLIILEEDAEGYDKAELAQRLCERNTSIGADGVEFFSWTGDFSGRIQLFNADGSIAEISGNGTRCVAAWMADELDSAAGDELSIDTDAGIRVCTIQSFREYDNASPATMITTDMDIPEFKEKTIELADGTEIKGISVNMGNPHFVIMLDHEDTPTSGIFQNGQTWEDIGQEICFHPDFPEQTNVEFVRPLRSLTELLTRVELLIFERGVGPTSSSGTGTSAAGTAMIALHGAQSHLDVSAPGGTQTVDWAGPGERLYLTGPATLIARGEAW